jgi:hypothetical protein
MVSLPNLALVNNAAIPVILQLSVLFIKLSNPCLPQEGQATSKEIPLS